MHSHRTPPICTPTPCPASLSIPLCSVQITQSAWPALAKMFGVFCEWVCVFVNECVWEPQHLGITDAFHPSEDKWADVFISNHRLSHDYMLKDGFWFSYSNDKLWECWEQIMGGLVYIWYVRKSLVFGLLKLSTWNNSIIKLLLGWLPNNIFTMEQF